MSPYRYRRITTDIVYCFSRSGDWVSMFWMLANFFSTLQLTSEDAVIRRRRGWMLIDATPSKLSQNGKNYQFVGRVGLTE